MERKWRAPRIPKLPNQEKTFLARVQPCDAGELALLSEDVYVHRGLVYRKTVSEKLPEPARTLGERFELSREEPGRHEVAIQRKIK